MIRMLIELQIMDTWLMKFHNKVCESFKGSIKAVELRIWRSEHVFLCFTETIDAGYLGLKNQL